MGKILDEDLIYEILSVVEEIPAGKVASYGQIARLIGWESCRPYCTRMERTEGTSGRRRCGI
jgi:alkylated DNA nucleotide flippase Atl1